MGSSGGMGAVAGGIRKAGGTPERTAHRHESLIVPIDSSAGSSFDEAGFISAIQVRVEAEIIASSAAVIDRQALGPAKFGIEYEGDELRGRIHISGRQSGPGSYTLEARLEEVAQSANLPDWGWMAEYRRPKGCYYAVTFTDDDPHAQFKKFTERIRAGIGRRRGQIAGMSREHGRSLAESQEYAEVYVWSPSARWAMTLLGKKPRVPSEYDLGRTVYFMNETALKMYRESGDDFEVIKTVSAEDLSEFGLHGPQMRGPYVPNRP